MIISVKAKVIAVIRSHHLVRKLLSYFDEVESRCTGKVGDT